MVDHVSPEKRAWLMSRVKSKDTTPELVVRSFLHRKGYRFRLHVKKLPGTPDIVLSKYKTVVFVHGCFWHRHEGCKKSTFPKSRKAFWQQKFDANVARFRRDMKALKKLGWKAVIIWQCEIKKQKMISKLNRLSKQINNQICG